MKNNDHPFDRPAKVCQAESLGQLMAHAGALAKEIGRDEKLNVQRAWEISRDEKLNVRRALEIGRTLDKARPLCPAGRWLEELEKTGISRQRASEWVRGAEAPAHVQAGWQSCRDMTRWLAESGHAQGGMSGAGHTVQRESEEDEAPHLPTPAPEVPDRTRDFYGGPAQRATVKVTPPEDATAGTQTVAEASQKALREALADMEKRAAEGLKFVCRQHGIVLGRSEKGRMVLSTMQDWLKDFADEQQGQAKGK